MQKKWFISLFLGIILSMVTLYLAFRNVPFSDLLTYLSTINYIWLVPTGFLVLLTFLLRVLRWQLLLVGYQRVGFWAAFHPLMIGFMMNCVLPGRVGELARPVLLRRQQGIPITTGLTTVAGERIFDILMLLVLFVLVFGTIVARPDLEVTFGSQRLNSQTLQALAWTMIRLVFVLLAGLMLVLIPWTRKQLKTFINFCAGATGSLLPALNDKAHWAKDFIIGLMDRVVDGLSLVRHPARLTTCTALTMAIWGITLLSYYVFTQGSPGINLNLTQLTTYMVVICFFIALPSVPGFWGLWEAGGVFALTLFDIPAKDAAGFTLVNHAVQMVPVIVTGWISALITGSNILHLSDKQPPETMAVPRGAKN